MFFLLTFKQKKCKTCGQISPVSKETFRQLSLVVPNRQEKEFCIHSPTKNEWRVRYGIDKTAQELLVAVARNLEADFSNVYVYAQVPQSNPLMLSLHTPLELLDILNVVDIFAFVGKPDES